MITDLEETHARALVDTHRCADCGGRLSVAWGGAFGLNQYILRCGRNVEHVGIKRYRYIREGYHPEKGWIPMVSENSASLVKYGTYLGEVTLSVEHIRTYMAPKATVAEAMFFLQKCLYMKLNPFLEEAYLVIYPETPRSPRSAAFIIGKDAYTRRADLHPQYDGRTDGIIVMRGGETVDIEGTLKLPEDRLVGGWCQVKRKDRDQPIVARVSMSEYEKDNHFWKDRPATMINKVAVCHALDAAFPNAMAGLQVQTEPDLFNEESYAGRIVEQAGPVEKSAQEPVRPVPSAREPSGEADEFQHWMEEDVPPNRRDESYDQPATLDRDLGLLREPTDLFHACFEDFNVQPRDVLRITGYSKAADMTGQNLQELYKQVAYERTRER